MVLAILFLYTLPISESDKRGKLFKTVVIGEVRRVSIFSLIIEGLEPGIVKKLNIRPIESKGIPFG